MATTTPPQDEKKGRTKDPQYDVFRRDKESGMWDLVNSGTHAANRRDAIVKATASFAHDAERYGDFAVVRCDQFKVISRHKKIEPQDIWT